VDYPIAFSHKHWVHEVVSPAGAGSNGTTILEWPDRWLDLNAALFEKRVDMRQNNKTCPQVLGWLQFQPNQRSRRSRQRFSPMRPFDFTL
jgi:hypothetical protein